MITPPTEVILELCCDGSQRRYTMPAWLWDTVAQYRVSRRQQGSIKDTLDLLKRVAPDLKIETLCKVEELSGNSQVSIKLDSRPAFLLIDETPLESSGANGRD